MANSNIYDMKRPATNLPRATLRDQRLLRAIQARRHLCPPRGGGRAWINGRQVGGADDRFAHLEVSHD
jgi:hypothetical protein